MNINLESEYKKGAFVGISQIILGHPFDTLKTWKQTRTDIKLNKGIINNLFRGISYPLFLSIGYNSFLFGFYKYLRNCSYSSFESGIISGGILGIVLNPFEYYKIQRQISNNRPLYYIPFRGLHYTIGRESLACGLYFTTYEYFTEGIGMNSFISGGISGCTSWALTYPIDTIKTRFQANPNKSGKY